MPQLIQKNADGTSLKQFDLKGKTLCVGRGEQADAQIGDEMMSRRHFEILEKNGAYVTRADIAGFFASSIAMNHSFSWPGLRG